MASSLAIEIGSHSIRAAISQKGKIHYVPLGYSDSRYFCPAVMAKTTDGKYLFGEYAENWLFSSPESFVHITDVEPMSPLLDEIYPALLEFILNAIINAGWEKPDSCLFIVPGNFPSKAKLESAAVTHNIGTVRFEAGAVAICSKYSSISDGESSMVFDLGHSSLNVSIIKRVNNRIQLIAVRNDRDCCGRVFDGLLLQDILSSNETDVYENALLLNSLAGTAAHIKEELSSRDEVTQSVIFGIYSINRSRFNNIISPSFSSAMQTCKESLNSAGIGFNDIKQVFLCGGCSQIPCVEDFIKKLFSGNGNGNILISNYSKHVDYQFDACAGAFYSSNSTILSF